MEYSHKGSRSTHTGPTERSCTAVMPIKLCASERERVCVCLCVCVCVCARVARSLKGRSGGGKSGGGSRANPPSRGPHAVLTRSSRGLAPCGAEDAVLRRSLAMRRQQSRRRQDGRQRRRQIWRCIAALSRGPHAVLTRSSRGFAPAVPRPEDAVLRRSFAMRRQQSRRRQDGQQRRRQVWRCVAALSRGPHAVPTRSLRVPYAVLPRGPHSVLTRSLRGPHAVLPRGPHAVLTRPSRTGYGTPSSAGGKSAHG